MMLTLCGALFLILLGTAWTCAGYMDREQARGITNIWFYALLPAMMLHLSQLPYDSDDAFLRHAFLRLGICVLCTCAAALVNRFELPGIGALLNESFKCIPVLALLLAGSGLGFILQHYGIVLPTILGSALSMLYNTVLPVSMFLIGNILAYLLGLKKERSV